MKQLALCVECDRAQSYTLSSVLQSRHCDVRGSLPQGGKRWFHLWSSSKIPSGCSPLGLPIPLCRTSLVVLCAAHMLVVLALGAC